MFALIKRKMETVKIKNQKCLYCNRALRAIKQDFLWEGTKTTRKFHKTCYSEHLKEVHNNLLKKKYGIPQEHEFIVLWD